MPNVLVFRDYLLPYSETWLLAQAEAMEVFTPVYAGLARVPGLSMPADRTIVVADQGKTLGKLRSLAFRYFRHDERFQRRLRAIQPRLIHAHFEGGGLHALPLAAKLQVPLITTCHGIDVTRRDVPDRLGVKGSIRKRIRKELWQKGSRFIAVSQFIKAQMIARGYPEDKTMVHYIGVDVEDYKEDLSIVREPIILFTGRLVEKKGCEYLIRAFAEVRRQMPAAELVIIGDGPLLDKMKTLAAEIAGKIHFLGSKTSSEVRTWMNRAKVFCVPSVTAADGDSEGLPIVFCEAQAMGLPIVSTYHSGIPEAVEHGKSGFLVKERDWEGLAANLLMLLTNTEQWHEFRSEGKRRVATLFNLALQTRALESLYGEVIAEHRARLGTP